MNKEIIIYADFGNSRAKFLDERGELTAYYYEDFIPDFFPGKFASKRIRLIYSSVINREIAQVFSNTKNVELINAADILEETSIIDYSRIKGIGNDRLLGLIGAISLGESNVITIDCGTAITINAMDKEGRVLGGTILPGIEIQTEGLKSKASKLNNINIDPPDRLLGINTDEAASSGVYYGIAGAIVSIVSKTIEENFKDKKVNIFLTGGSSSVILQYINDRLEVIHENQLVLKGIKYTYKKWLTAKR